MQFTNHTFQVPRYGWLVAIVPGLLIIMLAEFITGMQLSNAQANQRKSLNSSLINLSAQFQQELDAAIYFSIGMKAYIETNHGQIREADIAPWLTNLQLRGKHIRNIGLAPGNKITYIYPMAGNEAAMGFYYPDHPQQWPAVKEMIETHQPKLIGPFLLAQGGQGFAYREPVFLQNGQYWGLISIVLNADTLFASLTEQATSLGVRILIMDEQTNALIYDQGRTKQDMIEMRSLTVPGRALGFWVMDDVAEMGANVYLIRMGGWILGAVTFLLLAFFIVSIRERQRVIRAFQESQQRFVRAFSYSPQGMALVDNQMQWLETNPALCKLLNTTQALLKEKKLKDFLHESDQKKLDKIFNNLRGSFAGQETNYEQFEAQVLLGGNEKLNLLISVGICYQHRNITHWIIQCVDISERIKLEKLKSEFVSTVSHELRTPITSIHGALALITRGKLIELSGDAEKLLQIAYKNSQRLGLLINDLLDMEKLLAGKMVFDFQVYAIDQLVEQSLKDNQQYAANLGVKYQLANYLGNAEVLVDSLRFAQVMSNLLSNAAKFSPPGETVDIILLNDKNMIRIEVKDKGPGIAKEFRDRIFQKFSQADSSDTRQKGGTGLGLSIVKELVDRMGGIIGYESELDKGSNFYTLWKPANKKNN